MNHYDHMPNESDPLITIRLPSLMIKDLVARSNENGSDIVLEISRRLARSLERDLNMVETDNRMAYAAFQKVCESNTEL